MRTLLLLATFPFLFLLASCEQEEAVIAPEKIDHFFLIGDETSPYNFGYQIIGEEPVSDGVTTLNQYSFVLLAKDIYRQGYLSGVSNMMAIDVLSLNGPVTDFEFQFDSSANGLNPEDEVYVYGRYCKNLNFSLGFAEEDEMITDGEMTLTTNDDGSRTLTIDGVTSSGQKVSGSWFGEFVPAKTGF